MVLRSLCFLSLLAIAAVQLHYSLFEQTEYSRTKSAASLHKYQSNPFMLSWLAKSKHLFDADLELANSLYQQALLMNPVYIPAWLGLAELQVDQQKKENANRILDYTGRLTENIKRWRWEKALVAFQLDRRDVLSTDLAYIIKEIHGKNRNDALRMAFSLWPDPVELQDKLGSGVLEHLFRYAIRKKKVMQALILWDTYKIHTFKKQEKDTLAFINMLIGQGEIKSAARIWKKRFNPSTLFFNGDFSKKPLQTAFGWRIGKNNGLSWYFSEESGKDKPSSLHLHFKRKENINLYNIYQIVPLQGGKTYTLKGKVKTKKMTTDQWPYIEAIGYKCKAPYNRTAMFSSDEEWKDLYLVFEVPAECDAMLIRLRRKRSTRIDNKLAGDIWLTGLQIAETDAISTILD